jgi:hypothetical protein
LIWTWWSDGRQIIPKQTSVSIDPAHVGFVVHP